MAGWVLPTAIAGLEETPIFTALTLLDSASNGLPLATTLTPRCGLGVDRLSCLPCVLSEEDTRVVVEEAPRARDEGVVNGLTVVDPCELVELCELLAMAKLLELMVDDPRLGLEVGEPRCLTVIDPKGDLGDPGLTVCWFRDGICLSFPFFWSSSLVGEPRAFAESLPEEEASFL